jgi:type I restriction enzyme S subunit
MTLTRFADVVTLSTTRTADPLAAGIERFVGLEHIEPENLHILSWGNIADGTTFTSTFKHGQVLFGKRRAYQRKVAVADFDGVCSSDIYVFESKDPNVLLPEILPFICQSEGFYQYAIKTSAGSLSPRTNWSHLANYEFHLPSIDEQRRIADLLWAADEVCERYKDLLVKTNGLRIPLINELIGIDTPDDVRNIITGLCQTTNRNWQVLNVEDVCSKERQGVQVGPFGGSVSSKYFSKTGIPVLKINNITETGELDLSDMVFLDEKHAMTLAERYSVIPGDIVTAAQATIGRTAIVSKAVAGAIISQHLIRIAVDTQLCLSQWLHACFQTPLVIRQMYSVVQGGTRAGLNTNDVRKIRVPIPPLEVQKEFCKKINIGGESANKVSEHLENSRKLKKQSLMIFLG